MAPWGRKLNEFINLLNSSHETIKFTHEVSPSKINFLDVTVLLHNNSIATDLHVKSTDTHQYLLSSSCYPNHIKKSIPYSLALRIRCICSTDDNFKQCTNELLEFLCQRGHKRDYVKTQINKAFNVPRKNTLYYQHKKSNNRTVSVTTYNPSLPNFNNIIKKYYAILTASDHCKNAFKDPPLLAYRRPRNLRDTLVRAKIKIPKPSPSSPPKITSCNDGRCKTCKFIAHNTTFYTFHNTGQTRTIHQNLSCSSDNLIHMINCKRCLKIDTTLPSQYIGQTGRTPRERFREHRRGIQNNTDESIPIHFNLPHHTLNDVELIPLLKVRNSRDSYRYTMEQHFISTAGTLRNGINRTSDH